MKPTRMGCSEHSGCPCKPRSQGWVTFCWRWTRLPNPSRPSYSPSLWLPAPKRWKMDIPGKFGQRGRCGAGAGGGDGAAELPPTRWALIAPWSRRAAGDVTLSSCVKSCWSRVTPPTKHPRRSCHCRGGSGGSHRGRPAAQGRTQGGGGAPGALWPENPPATAGPELRVLGTFGEDFLWFWHGLGGLRPRVSPEWSLQSLCQREAAPG